MKKFTTLILALAIGCGLKAQTSLTEAVDFTATDIHGQEIHLFEILDGGQYVLIDFFYTTCSYCIQSIPKMVEAYSLFGCNMHDVFFLEIDDGDNESACMNWVNTYGVEYPTIAGTSGGTTINNQYGIPAYPTVILIAPNHQIVIQDLYPIPNTQAIVTALEGQGVQQHDCNTPSYDPQVTISIDQVNYFEVTATFTPNADCATYNYMLATESEIQQWMSQTELALPEYLHTYGFPAEETLSHTFIELEPETEYMIYAVPVDPDGNLGVVVQEPVTTMPGGTAEIISDFTGNDIDGNEIHLYDILDGGQYVLINFFLTSDGGGADIMPYMTESYRLFGCNVYDVFYMEFTPNGHDDDARAWAEQYGVEYPTISRDGGANDFVQAIPVGWYPTVMLINPNHEIVIRDLYPIINTQSIVDALEGESIEQHECPVIEGFTITPDTLNISMGCIIEYGILTISNNTTEDVRIHSFVTDDFYYLECLYGNENVTNGMTVAAGETIEIKVMLDVPMKEILEIFTGYINIFTSAGNFEIYFILNFSVNIDENATQILNLFPNPANDFVTLNGESLGTVRIYNALGQMVDEFEANGSELNINTAGYGNGVYVVKAGEKMLKFVVKQ